MNKRILLVVVGLVAAFGLIWWVGPREHHLSETWNFNSTRPEGAKAMADLYAALGMPLTITRTLPDTPGAPVLVGDEYYNDTDTNAIVDYARRGGTVVQVAGDHLDRVGFAGDIEFLNNPVGLQKSCDWPELKDVELVRVEDTQLYETTGTSAFCFVRQDHGWLIREQVGSGTIYTLGDGTAFVNKLIEADDNAILAVRLMERDGIRHGRVIRYRPVDVPVPLGPSILELVPTWVWVALAQAVVAFGALAYWRIIRPARVMHESLMTQLPGSTPVLAFGHYLWTTKRIGAVADMARQDLRTRLGAQLGVAESESISLIEVVAQATQLPKELIEYALYGPAPADRRALFELTLRIAEIDQAMSAGPRSTTP